MSRIVVSGKNGVSHFFASKCRNCKNTKTELRGLVFEIGGYRWTRDDLEMVPVLIWLLGDAAPGTYVPSRGFKKNGVSHFCAS